ncbi:MAG TPA: SRPBCC family protein [Gemmatimonadaceae bacterium]|nr:SRPBCC family protein [Gemmatimonadaceae bacterium]
MSDSNRELKLGSLAAAVAAGIALGRARTGEGGRIARLIGFALFGYAALPLAEDALSDAGASRRAVRVHEYVEVDRPIGEVWEFLKDFANLPRVIGSIRSVIDYEDGRSHWEAYAPSGRLEAWDVVVTKYVPRAVIAWQSVPAADVEMSGLVRFTPQGAKRTRLDVEVAYAPKHTTLNDAVHALLAPKQRRQLREDLQHLRFYLESLPSPSAVA